MISTCSNLQEPRKNMLHCASAWLKTRTGRRLETIKCCLAVSDALSEGLSYQITKRNCSLSTLFFHKRLVFFITILLLEYFYIQVFYLSIYSVSKNSICDVGLNTNWTKIRVTPVGDPQLENCPSYLNCQGKTSPKLGSTLCSCPDTEGHGRKKMTYLLPSWPSFLLLPLLIHSLISELEFPGFYCWLRTRNSPETFWVSSTKLGTAKVFSIKAWVPIS